MRQKIDLQLLGIVVAASFACPWKCAFQFDEFFVPTNILVIRDFTKYTSLTISALLGDCVRARWHSRSASDSLPSIVNAWAALKYPFIKLLSFCVER